MFSYNGTILSTASIWSWPAEIDNHLHTLGILLGKTFFSQQPTAFYILFVAFSLLVVKALEQELIQKRDRTIHPIPVLDINISSERRSSVPALEERKASLSKREFGNNVSKAISWKKASELVQTKTIESHRSASSSNSSPRKLLATLITGWRYNSHDTVEFKIEFRMDKEVFISWKRYSDLYTYDQAIRTLLNQDELATVAEFPRKSTLSEYITGRDKDECFLRARCRGLEKYLQSVLYGNGFREDTRIMIASYTRNVFVPHVASEM